MNSTDACTCYVRDLGDEALFTLRYGAHDPGCPVYRPSADPVDRAKDEAIRAHFAPKRQTPAEEAISVLVALRGKIAEASAVLPLQETADVFRWEKLDLDPLAGVLTVQFEELLAIVDEELRVRGVEMGNARTP